MLKIKQILLFNFLVIYNVQSAVADCANAVKPVVTDAIEVDIIVNELIVYICTFTTGDSAITSKCVDSEWTPITATCESNTATACSGQPTAPADSEEYSITNTAAANIVKAYQCVPDKAWLTGETVRVTQCKNDTWSEILDICDEGCSVPRHCADVAELGLTDDGKYLVVPSGEIDGKVYEVNCDLTSDGGKWTSILLNTKTEVTLQSTETAYKEGIMTSDASYFVGLDFLADVSKELPNDPAGNVLEILFRKADGSLVAFAIYNKFTVGPEPGYNILTLGEYHGDAGDGMCPHLGTEFIFSDTNAYQWWGVTEDAMDLVTTYNGSFLTNMMKWQPLESHLDLADIDTVEMRIRPTVEDNDEYCPAMVGTESWWTTVNAIVPYSRSVGTNITWECTGELLYEGQEGQERTTEGIATCEGTSPPKWSKNVYLPCTIKCPSGFELSEDERICLKFSTEPQTFAAAAIACEALDSSLALFDKASDMNNSMDGTAYFAGYNMLGQDVLNPQLPTSIFTECTEVCTAAEPSKCTTVTKPNVYSYVDCSTEHNYACMIPSACPADFKSLEGTCLQLLSAPRSFFISAVEDCWELGATLYFIPTVERANQFAEWFIDAKTADGSTYDAAADVFIGNNEVDGTMNVNGLYSIPSDLEGFLTPGDPLLFRYMTINPDKSWSIHPIDFDTAAGADKEVVCRYYGPQDCTSDPPAPGANMFRDWNNETIDQTEVEYNCYDGYFFMDDTTLDAAVSTCYGQFGGWFKKAVEDCIITPVCNLTTLETSSDFQTNDSAIPDSQYLNATVTFTCPEHMTTADGTPIITTTCVNEGGLYVFNVTTIPPCDKCLENITVENAITDYDASNLVSIDGTLTATCLEGHEWALGNTVQTITCLELGFNETGIMPCYRACVDSPPLPVAGDGVTEETVTANSVGTELTYNCTEPNFYFEVSEEHPTLSTTLKHVCHDNGTWVSEREGSTLVCIEACTAAPPAAPADATTDWDGFSRSKDQTITYTAASGHLFGNFLPTWEIKCNGSHWLPTDGSSESPTGEGNIFVSLRSCMDDPPAEIGGAEKVNFSANAKGFVGQELMYECPEGQATVEGLFNTQITCTTSAMWTAFEDPNFMCEDACKEPPPAAPLRASSNFSKDFTEGTVVRYECEGGFGVGVGFTIDNICLNGNWTYQTIPTCLTVTTPGPSTLPTIVLPPVSSYVGPYETTDVHVGEINDKFSEIEGAAPIETTNSLIGFGTAVALRSKETQCMEKANYTDTNKMCLINPSHCNEGLAFSLWVRPYFLGDDLFELDSIVHPNETDNKYIVSNGGNNEGSPGFAVYLNKLWLNALVSTGSLYWEISVYGPLLNESWSNVGVRFNKEFGLELYVNAKLVGSTNNSNTSTPTTGLDPSTLLVGCHKTSANCEYRNFVDADIDEIAFWAKSINASNIEFFLGGYVANSSKIDPAEFAKVLAQVNLANIDQQAAAAVIVAVMVQSAQLKPTKASPTASTSTGTSSSSSTSSTSIHFTTPAPLDEKSVEALRNLGDIILKMTDPTKVPGVMIPGHVTSYRKLLSTVSDLFKPDNIEFWKAVQEKTEKVGGMQIVNRVTKWIDAMMRGHIYTNNSKPVCYENLENNLYTKSCKMTIRDLKEMGKKIQEPDYKQSQLKEMQKKWDGHVVDRIVFPSNIFTDERCCNRPVSYTYTMYDTAGKFAVAPVNPNNLPSSVIFKVDSRLIIVTLTVDKGKDANGDIDKNQPLCEPNKEAMKAATIMFRAEHERKCHAIIIPGRETLLLENVIDTSITERYCAWWNENLSDYGAWDRSGCTVIETNPEYSACACNHFGVFAVLAEMVDPIEVPDDPYWLLLLRYILYSLSIIAVIIYITVVAISGDLKDQFHLIGVNLAVAILVGSILMLISDLAEIREDREACVCFGTMIHLMYGAVGTWALGLAHASFKGITAGVIGGHLKGYILLCWGAAIGFTGVPFLLFEPILFGDDPRCFLLGWSDYVKWSFFLVQLFCVLLGLFFALVVVCNLSTPALRKDNLIEDYGSFCRGAAFLVIQLAVVWVLGVVAYIKFDFTEPDFYPIFQILNAISGLCLLIFIGIGSTRFRSVLAGQVKSRREKLNKHAFGLPDSSDKGKNNVTESTSNLVSNSPTENN